MRLIDADALEVDWYDDYETEDGDEYSYAYVSKYQIDNAPTINAAPRWIPCEERLPEPNVAVLGYAPEFNNIFAVYYDSICGWMIWSPAYDEPFPSCQGEIVAWMPLPVKYTGGEE